MPPPDVRVITGSMPGNPHAGTTGLVENFGKQRITTSERRLLQSEFNRVRIGEEAGDAFLGGRIYKIVHYGVGPYACDYWDGGFVLCIWNGHVAAKGYAR